MIFEHIKRTYFPDLLPLLMDIATYEKYVGEGTPFSKDYAAKLVSLREDEKYQACILSSLCCWQKDRYWSRKGYWLIYRSDLKGRLET